MRYDMSYLYDSVFMLCICPLRGLDDLELLRGQ